MEDLEKKTARAVKARKIGAWVATAVFLLFVAGALASSVLIPLHIIHHW